MRLYTGIVNQDINPSPIIANFRYHGLNRHFLSHIIYIPLTTATRAGDTAYRLLQVDGGDIIGSHDSAAPSKSLGYCPTYASTSAGNKHNFISIFMHNNSIITSRVVK
jgi:hypothetical protein